MMRVMLYEAAQVVLYRRNGPGSRPGRCRSPGAVDEKGDRGAGTPAGRNHAPASGLMAPSSAGPGHKLLLQHENRAVSNPIGEHASSTERWNDVPRGTMDEVSSHFRLNLPFV